MHHLGYIEFDQQEKETSGLWSILWVVGGIVIILVVIWVFYKWWVHIKKKPLHIAEVALEPRPVVSHNYSALPTSSRSENAASSVVVVAQSAIVNMPRYPIYIDRETRFELADGDLIIQKECLERGGKLGSGEFGCVYKGIINGTTKVAVKTLHEQSFRHPDTIRFFLREALLMKGFNHNNVLSLMGVCLEEDGPSIVLPFMENGDLHSYITNEKKVLFTAELVNFAVDIAAGMTYLEQAKFVHRDLAARNCLLDSRLTAKVSDFGLSRDVYTSGNYIQGSKGRIPYPWTAPEALENGEYSTKTDVWSFGVLLWELVTRGIRPYCGIDNFELLKFFKKGYRLNQPKYCPLPLYKVMLACWNMDSSIRPTFDELHAYVIVIRNVLLENRQADILPAAEAAMDAGTAYVNVAIPAKHKDTYDSEDIYLNMEGRHLQRDILVEFG